MIVSVCKIELYIPSSHSLKEKRFILKSLKKKISNKFNVSVAEVGYQDKWQRAELAIALVTNSQKMTDQVYNKITRLIDNTYEAQIIKNTLEYY